jgi:hypothetical protein
MEWITGHSAYRALPASKGYTDKSGSVGGAPAAQSGALRGQSAPCSPRISSSPPWL